LIAEKSASEKEKEERLKIEKASEEEKMYGFYGQP
jgi:hypothetical protein